MFLNCIWRRPEGPKPRSGSQSSEPGARRSSHSSQPSDGRSSRPPGSSRGSLQPAGEGESPTLRVTGDDGFGCSASSDGFGAGGHPGVNLSRRRQSFGFQPEVSVNPDDALAASPTLPPDAASAASQAGPQLVTLPTTPAAFLSPSAQWDIESPMPGTAGLSRGAGKPGVEAASPFSAALALAGLLSPQSTTGTPPVHRRPASAPTQARPVVESERRAEDPQLGNLLWLVPYLERGIPAHLPPEVGALRRPWEELTRQAAVEPTYAGPRLTFPLTEAALRPLYHHFATQPAVPLHAKYALEILVRSLEVLREMPRVAQLTLSDGLSSKVVVVGELHGQLQDLLHLLQQYGSPQRPGGSVYVFIGDCMGAGQHGVEVLLLLLAFKLVYPESIYWIGGPLHPSDALDNEEVFHKEVLRKYNDSMYARIQEVRAALPSAVVYEAQVVMVHWGIFRPNAVPKEVLSGQVPDPGCMRPRPPWEVIVAEFLWGRTSQTFASRVRFCPEVGPQLIRRLRMVISSHCVPRTGRGFELTHDGKLVVLNSASHYLGRTNAPGAVVVFTPGSLMEFTVQEHVVWGPETAPAPLSAQSSSLRLTELLRMADQDIVHCVREVAAANAADLAWMLSIHEVAPRLVSLPSWRTAMTYVLGLSLPWTKFEAELLGGRPAGPVDYGRFLSRLRYVQQTATWRTTAVAALHDAITACELTLPEMLLLFDRHGTGYVTAAAVEEVLAALGVQLSPQQLEVLLWDAINSTRVDVMAFLDSLRIRPPLEVEKDDPLVQTMKGIAGLLYEMDPFWEVVTLFAEMDSSGDGRVPVERFVHVLRGLAASHWPALATRRAQPGLQSPRLPRSPLQPPVSPRSSALGAPPESPTTPVEVPTPHSGGMEELSDGALQRLAEKLDSTGCGTIGYLQIADYLGRPRCGTARALERLCRFAYAAGAASLTFSDPGPAGALPFEEVKAWLRRCEPFEKEPDGVLDALVCFMDMDCDGSISYQDFCMAFYFADLGHAPKEHISLHEAHFSRPATLRPPGSAAPPGAVPLLLHRLQYSQRLRAAAAAG